MSGSPPVVTTATSGPNANTSSAHHDHLALRARARRHRLGHDRLAAGGGVVDAERVLALIGAVDAVAQADARADPVLLATQRLGHDVRVGEMNWGPASFPDLEVQLNNSAGKAQPPFYYSFDVANVRVTTGLVS